MDSVFFYQPKLATVPNFKDRLTRLSATIPCNNAGSFLLQNGGRSDNSSDDDNFPPLSELLPKKRRNLATRKLSPKSITENTGNLLILLS
jgi:hypothetical protein